MSLQEIETIDPSKDQIESVTGEGETDSDYVKDGQQEDYKGCPTGTGIGRIYLTELLKS